MDSTFWAFATVMASILGQAVLFTWRIGKLEGRIDQCLEDLSRRVAEMVGRVDRLEKPFFERKTDG